MGYHGRRIKLCSSRRNIPSAYEHPEVVDAYLAHECQLGRVLGPITAPPVPLHTSRFEVIPKKSKPGTWRLTVDLSSPEGASVNDGIAPELCSNRYPSIVMDTRLPFSLRSALKLFTTLAYAVQWVIKEKGVDICIHYLNDYLFIEPPVAHTEALAAATQTLAELSIPMAPDKVEGPVTCLTFLGIELDSQTLTARLPADELQRLTSMRSGRTVNSAPKENYYQWWCTQDEYSYGG